MNGRVALLGVAVAALLTLSGCFGDGSDAAQDPELVAQEAMKAFGSSAGTTDGGDIKSISGTFRVTETTDEDGFSMSFGDASLDMLFEWGKADVVHLRFGLGSGGMTFNIEAWCTPEHSLVKWGNDIYATRPTAADPAEEDELCGDTSEMEMAQMGEGFDLFDSAEFEGLELRSVDTAGDGTITAVFHDPAENGTITATIDAKGRVTHLALESPEGSGTFDITYGTRDAIALPEANKRLPADVEWRTDIGGGEQTLTITSSPNLPPLDEMSARLILRDWQNGTSTEVVSFPTHVAGRQVQAGYTFEYRDHDADGMVSENDTFTFSHPSWKDSWWMEEDPDLFDEWAGMSVNESFTPAPGLAALLAIGLAALLFVSRRR